MNFFQKKFKKIHFFPIVLKRVELGQFLCYRDDSHIKMKVKARGRDYSFRIFDFLFFLYAFEYEKNEIQFLGIFHEFFKI